MQPFGVPSLLMCALLAAAAGAAQRTAQGNKSDHASIRAATSEGADQEREDAGHEHYACNHEQCRAHIGQGALRPVVLFGNDLHLDREMTHAPVEESSVLYQTEGPEAPAGVTRA
eukprot:scaffold7422_cov134-Isochrysis_galbana.AAC.13